MSQSGTHLLSDSGGNDSPSLLSEPGKLAYEASIANAWARCRDEYNLDPAAAPQKEHVGAEALKHRIEELGLFERISAAEMHRLFGQIAQSRHVLVLTDSGGVVLNALSDPAHASMLRDVDLGPGFVWDERHEGTNGPGTCLHDRQPVVVHRDDHFFFKNRQMTCSAVPIWGPNGMLAGVLDVSCLGWSDSRDSQLPMIALASTSARIIEHQHFISSFKNCMILRFHQHQELAGLHCDSLLAIDDQGRVKAADSTVPHVFGYPNHDALTGRTIEELFDVPIDRFLEHAAMRPLETLALTHRGLPHGYASVWPSRKMARSAKPVSSVVPGQAPFKTAEQGGSGPEGRVPLAAWNCSDPAIMRNIWCLERLMDKHIHILLQGETGTGKDTFAKAIHHASSRHDKPFIAVSCAAIPETLIESELFGYSPGAFTGARGGGRRGKVLSAHGGTLFLNEIGDMPLAIQARLLRVLEEKEVTPLGSDRVVPVDLRVISATHRDLPAMVSRGEFRTDLYYRLNGFTLHMPSLRDRSDREDLIQSIAGEESGSAVVKISQEARDALLTYSWPGNIRELRNVLRMAVALAEPMPIEFFHLPHAIQSAYQGSSAPLSFERAQSARAVKPIPERGVPKTGGFDDTAPAPDPDERARLLEALTLKHWRISAVAASLGISRNTLYRKLHAHGLMAKTKK